MKVPATIANLGPGFDFLGVAVDIFLGMTFKISTQTRFGGPGVHRPIRETYVHRAFVRTFERAGLNAPDVEIWIRSDYPSARGLGASASAIVAGAVAGRALGDPNLTNEEIADIAIELEGHSDNVLPALLGGLVLTIGDKWQRFQTPNYLSPVVSISPQSLRTRRARQVLPKMVSPESAIANSAASAAFLSAYLGFSPYLYLYDAMTGWLHEPYRFPLMPETAKLHDALRAEGFATALAGAGPSLISIVPVDDVERVARKARKLAPIGWEIATPKWNRTGARVSKPR